MTRQPSTAGLLITALFVLLTGGPAFGNSENEVTRTLSSPSPVVRTDEIVRLLAQAHTLEGSDLQRSLVVAKQALEQARVQHLPAAELASLLQVAKSLRLVNDYPGALQTVRAGLLLTDELKDDATRGELLVVRGLVEWNQARIPEATIDMVEALRLGEALENKPLQLGARIGQGLVRMRTDDLDGALPCLEAARLLAQETGDDRLGSVLNSLGNVYLEHKNYPRALEYYEQALAVLEPRNNQRIKAYVLLNLGQLYSETGDQEKSGRCLDDSMAICQRFDLRRGIADIYYLRGARDRRLGHFTESTQNLDRALAIARTLNNPDLFVSIYEEYVQTAEARGDYQAALAHTRQLAEQMEIVRGEKARRQSTELQARYEAETRARQIKLLQRDHELEQADLALKSAQLRQARTRYAELAAAMVLGAIGAVAILRAQRRRVRLTAQTLAETRVAKEEIEAEDARKARLLTIAARDLSESENRFRTAFESSALGLALVSLQGRWLRVNPALCKIVGYEESELLAIDFQTITHPDDLAEDTRLVQRLIAGEFDTYHLEKRYLRRDGAPVWTWLDASLVRDPATNAPLYFVSQVQDISERRRAQEELRAAKEEAEKASVAKNEFLSRMSHELRTPLNAILGFGQLLELDDLGDRHNQSVAHILRGGRHLLELINEVLDITRIENGSFNCVCEPTPVRESVRGAVDLLLPLAERARVGLVVDWEAIDPEMNIEADPRRLKQVLLNLLSNAIKYNRPEGQVLVRCQEVGSLVRLEIEDTGVGMAPGDLDRIFEPFTRLSATEMVPGTGLGLSLSRGMTEAMGGRLTVRSEPGRGSTFALEFARSAGSHGAEPALEPVLSVFSD